MGKINQTRSAQINSRGVLNRWLYKKSNIWLTALVVLSIVAAYSVLQVAALLQRQAPLVSSSQASTTGVRSRLRTFADFLFPRATVQQPSGTANSSVSGGGLSVVATPGQAGSIPTGSCDHISSSIPRTFADPGSNSGDLNQDSAAARDAAWRASNPNFPGPSVGPGAPTVAARGTLSNVSGLFAVAGQKTPFQFSAISGKDAFTVLNPQGGIAEKFSQKNVVVDWGDGKITSSLVGNKNYDHVYAAAGGYTIKAKAWYFCYDKGTVDAHGRGGVYAVGAIDVTKPLHVAPGSPEATFAATVVSAEDGAGAILAGPNLLMKNGESLLTSPGNVINQKNKVYKPSDQGGPEKLSVVHVSLKNTGTTAIKIQKIMFNDTSVFARQSDKKVVAKRGGSEIGVLAWPILGNNPGGVANYGNLRTGVITLSAPLTIAPGQSEILILEVEIITAKFDGRIIPSDISHQFCITGLELPNQPLGDHDTYTAGGRDSKSSDGGKSFTFSFPPGCGEPFEVRNNPNTPVGKNGVDAGG